MMLEILETGKALYALAAVCVLGLLSRLMARNLYKGLIRETDNMTMTKNRYLRDLRQKAENTYRLNQGIQNTRVYLEKQLMSYRFLGLTLNGWANLSGQFTVLCFLLGGAAAFGAYWYRCDSYYIVLYGAVGVLAGLLTLFVDFGVNLGERKNQLVNALQDYMENSLFNRLAREAASALEVNVRDRVRDINVRDLSSRAGRSDDDDMEEDGSRVSARNKKAPRLARKSEDADTASERHVGVFSRDQKRGSLIRDQERSSSIRDQERGSSMGDQKRGSSIRDQDRGVLVRGEDREPIAGNQEGNAPIRDVDYLKRSLEQIAASRERNPREGDWIKDLSPKELELIGEILKQYLA